MNQKLAETTLSIDNQNKFFLQSIKDELEKPVSCVNGIITELDAKNRYYVSLAYPIEHKPQMTALVRESVARVISVSYKKRYLLEKIRITNDDLTTRTLVNTMCIFDSNIDNRSLVRMFDNPEIIVIDGVYNFRSKNLKRKWDEIIELSNANDVIFNNKSIVRDFLRFLLEAVPFVNKKLFAVLNYDGFELFDEKNKRIVKQKFIYPDLSEEEILMYNIICQKPRMLVFMGKIDMLSDEFRYLADYLFAASYESLTNS